MSLRYALLALIEVGPTTGYALTKLFDQSATRIWHAQHSQIYTELRRMESEGLVVAQTMPRGEKAIATKRPYVLTARGAEELASWVAAPWSAPSLRDPAYLKATYLEYGTLRQAREQFRAHRAHYELMRDQLESHVEQIESHSTELVKRRLSVAPPASHEAVVAFKTHAYRGLIRRAVSEIEWAQQGLELVERLARQQNGNLDAPIMAPSEHTPAELV